MNQLNGMGNMQQHRMTHMLANGGVPGKDELHGGLGPRGQHMFNLQPRHAWWNDGWYGYGRTNGYVFAYNI